MKPIGGGGPEPGKAVAVLKRCSTSKRIVRVHRRYIKGQKYTLLSRKENLTLAGKKAAFESGAP